MLLNPHRRIHHIGRYSVVFHQINNSESFVISTPTATYVAIKQVRDRVFYFQVILIMIMTVANETNIRIIIE